MTTEELFWLVGVIQIIFVCSILYMIWFEK